MNRPSRRGRARGLRLPTGLRGRIVATTGVLTLAGMTVLVALVWLVLERAVDANVHRLLTDRADTVAQATTTAGGTLAVGPLPADRRTDVWVFDSAGRLVDGPTGATLDRQATGLATVTAATYLEAGDWMLRAAPLPPEAGRGVVVVAVSMLPYDQTKHLAALVSAVLGAVVVAAVVLLTAWSARRVLAPVAGMARDAAAWSSHDLDRRFDLGPPRDEITELGQVLDQLLDRVARAILAEQRLTAELAHQLRTPLTVVRAQAELAGLDAAPGSEQAARLGTVVEATDTLTTVIDTLLSTARAAASVGATCAVQDVLAAATDPLLLPAGGPSLTTTAPTGLRLAVPEQVAVQALNPLVANAVRHARRTVAVRARASAGAVVIEVVDDGDGVHPDDRDAVFTPGWRGAAGPGSGLGLPLARRIARSAGGDVTLGAPSTFRLTLPAGPTR
jgi:signal transduction histidine kinase